MSSKELAATAALDDGTLSVTEVAERLGMGPHGVRKALRERRITRCNSRLEPARFTLEEVERFAAARESGERTNLATPSEEIQLAAADSVGAMMKQAQDHAIEFARVSLETMKHRDQVTERERTNLLASLLRENERLTKRVETLEERNDEVNAALDLLREQKHNDQVTLAETDSIKKKTETAIGIAKVVLPALAARIFGGEQLTQGAMMGILKSLTNEQRDQLMQSMHGILTNDQLMALMTLLAEWSAKESKQAQDEAKEKAPPPTMGDGASP